MKKLFFEKNYLAPVIACLLTFSFFIPNLIRGKIPIPADILAGLYHPWRDIILEGYNPARFPTKNPLITDPVLQTYPWKLLVVNNLKEGKLPLWNPYSFSGQPLLANVQSAPFQITNLLFFIFPFKIAWSIQVILPSVFLTLFMYLFLRSLKLSQVASVFGGFALPFSGFYIAWLSWGTIITTAMWLPLILLAINKIFQKPRLLWFLILTLAITQTILSGHWQTAFYILLTSVFYFTFLLTRIIKTSAIVIGFLSFIASLLIAAPQILPSLEFIRNSAREIDQGYFEGRQDWFLPWQNLIQLIAPDYFGNPVTYNYWGIWNYAEFVSFIGIIPLGLALQTIFKKDKNFTFFVILSAIALVLALPNVISKIPYTLGLPYIDSIQPSRIISIFIFSTTVLAAFGFDLFIGAKSISKILIPSSLVVISFGLLLVLTYLNRTSFPIIENIDSYHVALRNLVFPALSISLFILIISLKLIKIKKSILVIAIFIFSGIELFRFGFKFTPFSKLSWIFPETATTNFLTLQEKPFRIMATDRRILSSNTTSVYNVESVSGYDPLYLKNYAHFVSSWESNRPTSPGSFNRIITPHNFNSKIADFLNIKYLVTFDEIESDRLAKVFEEGTTKIFINKNALPRAFFVNEVIKVKSQNDELAFLFDQNSNLRKTAVSAEFEFPKQEINTSLNFKEYSDQGFKLETITDKITPLIVSNVNYPGWQATIDDQKIPITNANYMFQSILIPSGTHTVEFKFLSKSFQNGLYLSLIGFILALMVSIYLWQRKYR